MISPVATSSLLVLITAAVAAVALVNSVLSIVSFVLSMSAAVPPRTRRIWKSAVPVVPAVASTPSTETRFMPFMFAGTMNHACPSPVA